MSTWTEKNYSPAAGGENHVSLTVRWLTLPPIAAFVEHIY